MSATATGSSPSRLSEPPPKRLTRRRFLQAGGAAAGALVLSKPLLACGGSKPRREEVVVVFQYTWDTSLTQRGRSGLITVYSGGADGADLGVPGVYGPAPENLVGETLDVLERVAPGIRRGFNGRALAYDWTADPWARGSYAAFLPGQTVRFAAETKRPEGGIHFAGEHTSVAFQGFLEGAVESGERAAREVLAAR